MALPDAVNVIQATLAPAFLISGTSVFLNFTQTRLFRIVDRARAAAAAPAPSDAPRVSLLRRARLLRNAIALGVLTVALAVLAAILVMASEMLHVDSLASAAPWAFAAAMLALLAALVHVFWDTVLSVRAIAPAP